MRRPARPGDRLNRQSSRHQRSGGDLLYGRNAVLEALRGPRKVNQIYLAEGIQPDHRVTELIEMAEARGIVVESVPRHELDHWISGGHHQGVVAHAASYQYATLGEIIERGGNLLLLDHLQDPQNLGTLLRAAEATAIGGVVIPADRGAAVTPAVVNASAGAVEHLAIAQVTNLGRSIDALKAVGWWIAGLDTVPDALDLFNAELPLPIALAVGSEGSGLSSNIRRRCDLILSLPMQGQIASLNAATAGAIALFDLVRRQRSRTSEPRQS